MPRYIVDGNSLFLNATETAWRGASSSHFGGGGIIVAVGYPLEGKLWDAKRRSHDLTPPTAIPVSGYGGAGLFLEFIERRVRPAVKARFPKMTFLREALYGHSYGGLFALYALFTRPRLFDCYIASSPSIWWNGRCILDEAKAFVEKEKTSDEKPPSLVVSWGSFEQNPPRWDNEPLDSYEERKKIALMVRMTDNARDICKILEGCQGVHTVLVREYEKEDHISVMSCSTGSGLTTFLEDWPLPPS